MLRRIFTSVIDTRAPLAFAAALAVLGLAMLASSPASALGPTWQVLVSKHKDGPFISHTESINLGPRDSKNVYWKVKDQIGTGAENLRFDDYESADPSEAGLKIRWFKGAREITDKVQENGYRFDLPEGKSVKFRSLIKANQHPDGYCLAGRAVHESLGGDVATVGTGGLKCIF